MVVPELALRGGLVADVVPYMRSAALVAVGCGVRPRPHAGLPGVSGQCVDVALGCTAVNPRGGERGPDPRGLTFPRAPSRGLAGPGKSRWSPPPVGVNR